jgi:hypothetical protein
MGGQVIFKSAGEAEFRSAERGIGALRISDPAR